MWGKCLDTFAPIGPCIVTPDEVPIAETLKLTCTVNDEVVQDSSTEFLVFDIAGCIEYVSSLMTLLPGDVITTGTPPGVGCFRDPPRYLRPGDVVECTVERIGSIRNTVRDE